MYNPNEYEESTNILFDRSIKEAVKANLNERKIEKINIEDSSIKVKCKKNQVQTILIK